MKWNNHSNLEGCHAFMGASKYHWINYDANKIKDSYFSFRAIEMGTRLHDFAHQCILLKQKLPKSRKTLNDFVNDAIGYNMRSEQVLYYSDACYGTADAISFKDGLLRIHDLKTGTTQTHMEQLMIYAAIFCLEYGHDPKSIKMELRIYQNDDILVCSPDPQQILDITKKIIEFSKIIMDIKKGEIDEN